MTDPHRPDSPDRDPALDAAWKLHSTELPPARLDAAILAAAHREARTRPHAVGDDDGIAHARGPSRAWWGLAAAATIGAIAFGVLQLAPPLTTDQSAMVATDTPRTTPERAPQAEILRDAPPPTAQPQRSPAVSAIPPVEEPAVRREDDRRSALTRAPDPVPSAAPRSNANKPAEQEKRRADTREGQRQKAGESSVASNLGAFAEAPTAIAPPPASPEAAMTPRAFPGAASAPPIAAPPAPLPVPATPPHDALAKSEAASNAVDARRRESGERMAAEAPTQPQPQTARRAQADTVAQAAAAESVAKLQAARTPAAWIERIRALHAEQRFDEAARELNAFREAYPDADKRLPPELSAWAASIKRN